MKFKILTLLVLLISTFGFANFENHLKKVENKSDQNRMRNIDFIYLINLDERPEKLAKSLYQLNTYGIYPCRFSAVNGWKLSLETIHDVGLKFQSWMQPGIWGDKLCAGR